VKKRRLIFRRSTEQAAQMAFVHHDDVIEQLAS
jgi:hypothetical protein